MRYIVTKNFLDKYTGENFEVGAVYETINKRRASDLENGGYIAPENTEYAQCEIAQGNTQGQDQQLQQEVEPYTVLNGQHVPLKEALKVEEMREENINTTGIRQEHDNDSEPVKAGAKAKGQGKAQGKAQGKQAGKPAALRQSNMQSGQQDTQQHTQQAQQQVKQQEQQAQQASTTRNSKPNSKQGKHSKAQLIKH